MLFYGVLSVTSCSLVVYLGAGDGEDARAAGLALFTASPGGMIRTALLFLGCWSGVFFGLRGKQCQRWLTDVSVAALLSFTLFLELFVLSPTVFLFSFFLFILPFLISVSTSWILNCTHFNWPLKRILYHDCLIHATVFIQHTFIDFFLIYYNYSNVTIPHILHEGNDDDL